MTIVEGQLVEVKWNSRNKESLIKKGYVFTKIGDILKINISDLNKGSNYKIQCICDYCKKTFKRVAKLGFNSQKHFCSNKCKCEYLKLNPINQDSKIEYHCDMCKNPFKVNNYRIKQLSNGKRSNLFCSRECQGKWQSLNNRGENNPNFNSIKLNCKYCGNEFSVPKNRENKAKFCSDECKRMSKRKKIKTNCGTCGKEIETVQSKINNSKSGKVFCSNKCVGVYNSKQRKNRINKTCKICNKEYEVIPSLADTSVTCSVECQHIWQSKYLVGENANGYNSNITRDMRMHNCDWCGNEYELNSPYKIKQKEKGKQLFCSQKCYREWYAKEWSQSLEWKNASRKRAVKMLEDGLFNHTDTQCQTIVNDILNELNIKYENEYNCKYYSIDNYLVDSNLMIEVMGAYWHADPRIYNEINYQMQVNRIKNDKAKKTYVKNNYSINILYLWEIDIIKNQELCKSLIKEYIKTKGQLKFYDSFNYNIVNEKLETISDTTIPYMDYDIDDLKSLINIVGEKKSKKQKDKWTTFKCDVCGKEKEQLTSHYIKSKSHCCSIKCASEYKRGKRKNN